MNAAERMEQMIHEQVTASHGRLTDAQASDAVGQEHWTLVKLKELAADVVRQSRGTLTKAQAWNTVLDSEPGRQLYQAYRQHRIETLRRR
jgi:hypothetical protein